MRKLNIILMTSIVSLVLFGCKDDWNDHYDRSGSLNDETVYQLIKENPALQKFAKMVDIAGYDKMLNATQTFTVWAPSDEALAAVDLNDVDEVTRIVGDHVSRFNISSSTAPSQGVRMYNGKVHYYSNGAFGGVNVVSADNICKNGVLHVVSNFIPYSYNLYEYIGTHDNTSSIAGFIKRYDEKKFNEEASTPVDVNENGATVYDSVMVSYNRLFEHKLYGLGHIASEDSVYTMIVPDNTAWAKAYERISPYFNAYDADSQKADSIKATQTSLAILNDLIYRQVITDPGALSKIVSTSGSEITDVASLFNGTQKEEASNGMLYLASNLNYNNVETWNKELKVECEEQLGRTPGVATSIYTRTVTNDNALYPEISEARYIEVQPTTVSGQPNVVFEIPNVLSGAYDIYVSFVPASIEDNTVTNDSTKLQFTLTYLNDNGKSKSVSIKDSSKTNNYVTSGTKMTYMKIQEGFKFPVSNYYDNLWLMDENHDVNDIKTTTTLMIGTNVSATEFNKNIYTRHFRVDKIIFVPVQL